ncbi:LysR family transcriptional regulator [Shinella sp. H4-D48]|uniref:LysR family transcriptional regulator n=1 Tax=Shinella sedimenti TaxID=2919913 RepID=A0ABT0CGS7_9HYPH|nr:MULTISPECIES: LysR family transcriptional regulator [Shinella]MCJ8147825.1 LysR family transcriptional regulator [Shinella sedimenti]UNK36850.1 LysR family transcriptional regulator [Shinella sp. H4-D48]
MQDLNDLALYAAVVRHKGFTAAANALGVPKSKISKRIAALEEQLGVRLIERSTRKLSVTDIGKSFYDRCEAVLSGVEAAEAVVAVAKAEPAGMVRMSMPPGFAPMIAEVLPGFMKRYPLVRLSIITTGRPVDLIEERIDVALRVRDTYDTDQSLVVRRFASTRRYLAASPAFLARHGPIDFDTIALVPTVSMQENTPRAIWTLHNASGGVRDISHSPVLSCSDFAVLERATLEGIGLGLLPDMIAERGFRTGLLTHVLPDWSGAEAAVHAVFTSRHGMLPAVRALIDHLAENLPRSLERCQEITPGERSRGTWSI